MTPGVAPPPDLGAHLQRGGRQPGSPDPGKKPGKKGAPDFLPLVAGFFPGPPPGAPLKGLTADAQEAHHHIGGAALIPVAIDNGNDALKGATLRAEPAITEGATSRSLLTTIRVPTAFALAQAIQGHQEVTFTCDGVSFWAGATALAHGGDALSPYPLVPLSPKEVLR